MERHILDSRHAGPRAVIVAAPDSPPRGVLYLNDGQNLFDPATAYGGQHWRAAETADELIGARRIPPLIIVGIEHAGEQRAEEYTPTRDAKGHGGGAAQYERMLLDEILPFVERTYGVHHERNTTGLGGSSLGALAALYAGLRHPDVFGRLALLSPALWWDQRVILRLAAGAVWTPRPRIWLDCGTREGGRALDDARVLRDLLRRKGFRAPDLKFVAARGAAHHEAAWARRFPRVLEFLFGR